MSELFKGPQAHRNRAFEDVMHFEVVLPDVDVKYVMEASDVAMLIASKE